MVDSNRIVEYIAVAVQYAGKQRFMDCRRRSCRPRYLYRHRLCKAFGEIGGVLKRFLRKFKNSF